MQASETPASASDVYDLAARLRLDEVAHRRAVELTGLAPKRSDWLRHLDRFLIVLGSLLIVTGIAAFFAWNWDGLGPMARFALIQGAFLGAAGLASWLRPDTPGGRGSLFAAAFLVGVLFAVLYASIMSSGKLQARSGWSSSAAHRPRRTHPKDWRECACHAYCRAAVPARA